jgi:CRP/FNR family transcriptional regulator
MMLIKSGTLRTYLSSKDDREITMYRLRAGEICVVASNFSRRFNTSFLEIEAVTKCEILLIDAVSYAFLCAIMPPAKAYFDELLSERLYTITQALKRIVFTSVEKRVAFFLLDELEGVPDGDNIVLTHDQLAHHVGCTREVVTLALEGFKRAGLVGLGRGNINILDKSGLEGLIP